MGKASSVKVHSVFRYKDKMKFPIFFLFSEKQEFSLNDHLSKTHKVRKTRVILCIYYAKFLGCLLKTYGVMKNTSDLPLFTKKC